ncbi:MAG TPA: tetratricopeptide repeat protein [Phycisphaerales bacterium]|nr:tetratricopeptide repeat protein [Phycisphaerales bacterium]
MRGTASRRTICVLALTAGLLGAGPRARAQPEDDRAYRAGIGLLNKGLHDLAAPELRAYLRDHPEGAEATNARYALAVCLVRQGKHAEASRELGPVLAADAFEFGADALLLHAQCAAALGDDAGAAASLTRLVESPGFTSFAQPDRAMAMLGESLYRLGSFQEAARALADVASRWPSSPSLERAELFGALSQVALEEYEAAAGRAGRLRQRAPQGAYAANAALIEAQCRHRLKDLPAALRLYESATETGTGAVRAEAFLGLARAARAQRDFGRAEQALKDATDPPVTGELADRIALEQGKLLLDQGRAEPASQVFAELEERAVPPLRAEAALSLGRAQVALGRHAHAAERLAEAATRHAQSDLVPDMLFERAGALALAGRDDDALEAWRQWRAKYGTHELATEALAAEAWCAHRAGRFDDSLELCDRLRHAEPGPRQPELLALLIGENHYAAGRAGEALAAYESFLAQHASSDHAWRAGIRRGLCLSRLDREGEAGAVLEALLAQPGDGATRDPALRRAAMTTLADRCLAAQDWAQGERWFAELATDAGNASEDERRDAMLRHGICIQRQGRSEEAIALFDRLIAAAPGSKQAPQARFERGQSLVELNRLDEARAALEEVAADHAADAELVAHALRHLSAIALRQARPEDAARILAQLGASGAADDSVRLGSAWLAAGKYAEAEEALDRALEAAPDAAPARVWRAIAINRQGRHAEALAELGRAGEPASLDGGLLASARYEKALALRSLGRDDEARESYRLVLAGAPPRLEAYSALDLAQMESKAGRHAEAAELVDRALAAAKLEAGDAGTVQERGTYLRGACLLHLGKPAEAAQVLKDFGKKHPKSALLAAAQLLRGEGLLGAGRAREAAEEFAHAAAAGADDVRSAALLRLGEAWAACQEWNKSEEAYATFREHFPRSELWFQATFGLGWARENAGRHEPAMEAYRQVVARHKGPTAARAQFQVGECLYAQGNHEQAVAELLKTDVLFDYPEWSAAALYEAGRCLAEMGRPHDSNTQFDELSRRFPETHWAKLAKQGREANAPAPLPGRPQASAPHGR